MKKLIYRIILLALACSMMLGLCVSAAAAEGGSFNAGLQITETDTQITVEVDNSEENNTVLASQQPKLTIPCGFANACVMYNGEEIESTLADGKITFTVSAGGEYQILSVEGEEPAELKFSGASLTLQHNLAINFKASAELFAEGGYTDPYVEFVWGGKTVTVSDYTVQKGKYVFAFRNIAPNQMNDTITATLWATLDGEAVCSETKTYSIADYCYGMLKDCSGDDYAELRTLLVDILNYGAVSQQYTSYNTANLVNAGLTAEQAAWGTSGDPALTSVLNTNYAVVENPAATWKGAGLALNDSVSVRLKFIAEDVEGLSVKVQSGETTWTIGSDAFIAQDGVYYVYFNGLNAGQMRNTIYLTICDGDTPVSNTVSYSIESYAYEKQNSTIAYLADLVKAMMRYGDAAYAFAN